MRVLLILTLIIGPLSLAGCCELGCGATCGASNSHYVKRCEEDCDPHDVRCPGRCQAEADALEDSCLAGCTCEE